MEPGNIPENLSALRQVMAQQGSAGSPLNQVTPQAPTFKPNVAPSQAPQGGGMPIPPPSAQMPNAQGAANPQAGLPQGSPEAQIILKALTKRLDTIDKLELGQGGL